MDANKWWTMDDGIVRMVQTMDYLAWETLWDCCEKGMGCVYRTDNMVTLDYTCAVTSV